MRRNASAYAHPRAGPGLLGAVAEELAEPVARLDEPAGVAEQAVDLALERVADVDPGVRLERAREVHRPDLVHVEALADVLGEVVRVARPPARPRRAWPTR